MKPMIVSVMIVMMALQKIKVGEEGVDMHYYKRSVRYGKATRELESVEDQINMLVHRPISY